VYVDSKSNQLALHICYVDCVGGVINTWLLKHSWRAYIICLRKIHWKHILINLKVLMCFLHRDIQLILPFLHTSLCCSNLLTKTSIGFEPTDIWSNSKIRKRTVSLYRIRLFKQIHLFSLIGHIVWSALYSLNRNSEIYQILMSFSLQSLISKTTSLLRLKRHDILLYQSHLSSLFTNI
jgi:hypothetical protein